MSFDPAEIRSQFPILNEEKLGRAVHYLDNGATSQMPEAVLNAINIHETAARSNVHRSVHFLAERATRAYEGARDDIAAFLNAARREEVVFTSGCTAAINLVAHTFGETLSPGDEILISVLEHHSNIVPWHMLAARKGLRVRAIPATADGELDLGKLDTLVTPKTRLIAVAHGSNVTGAITDVGRVVAAAKNVGARVLLDGAQMVPHSPVDVQALGVDFYAFAGHKAYGPNGVGVLWMPYELAETLPPFMGGGEMISTVSLTGVTYAKPPLRFEAGTPPIANAVGLGAALNWLQSMDRVGAEAHMKDLTDHLINSLSAMERVAVIGPTGNNAHRLPVVSFTVDGIHPHDVAQILDGFGVAVRGGHHCAQPFMDSLDIAGTTRASLSPYNTMDDITALTDGLREVLKLL